MCDEDHASLGDAFASRDAGKTAGAMPGEAPHPHGSGKYCS